MTLHWVSYELGILAGFFLGWLTFKKPKKKEPPKGILYNKCPFHKEKQMCISTDMDRPRAYCDKNPCELSSITLR